MPSASAKTENVTSFEVTDPVKAIATMLEKRIRNLEKRKAKLVGYQTEVKNGKVLNEDQKLAIDKYDQVIGMLEFTREFSKSMNSIVIENAKQQKKTAMKEKLEREKGEIQRLQETFLFHHILTCLRNENVKNDFLNGENGAVKLTEDEFSHLDELYKILGPVFPDKQEDIISHFQAFSEKIYFLVKGKGLKIAGTTYNALNCILNRVKKSGYFLHPSVVIKEDVAEKEGVPVDNLSKPLPFEIAEPSNEIIEHPNLVENFHLGQEMIQQTAFVPPPEVELKCVTTINLQNGPLKEVLSSQGSFDFLQESQIDLDGPILHYKTPRFVLIAPHMDPAVVAVHQMAPPPVADFPVSNYPVATPLAKEKPLLNGSKPSVTSTNVTGSPQQPLVNNLPRASAPIASAQAAAHDFDPSHPIPTQTFTNQSFAVMQNMMLPQAYVPVTVHHGPIPPPHMAPIAVVPGLSSPVTSAAPAMPIHMPVAPVMLAPTPVVGEKPGSELPENDAQGKETANENDSTLTPSVNINERNGNTEGYAHSYRGGFRGRGPRRGGYFRRPNNYNGRGGYQNNYYQDRNNGYNSSYRRNNIHGPRGIGNNRERNGANNFRTQPESSQQPQEAQQ